MKNQHLTVLGAVLVIIILAFGVFAFTDITGVQPVQVNLAFIPPTVTCPNGTKVYYAAQCGTVTTTTSASTTVSNPSVSNLLVADTWVISHVQFKDGSSHDFKTGQSIRFSLMNLVATIQGKQVQTIHVDVPALSYDVSDAIPKDVFGTAFPWWYTAAATITIKVNDATAYGPITVNTIKQCKDKFFGQLAFCDATVGNVELAQDIPFDLSDWMQAHKMPTGAYTYTVQVSETWALYFIAGSAGAPVRLGQDIVPFEQQVPFSYDETSTNAPATFAIDASPAKIVLGTSSGFTDRFSVTVLAGQGFTGVVSLSATGLPSGISSRFATQSASLQPLASLTTYFEVTSSGTAQAGNYTVTITASSQQPAYSANKQVMVTIQENGQPRTSSRVNTRITLNAPSGTTVLPGVTIEIDGRLTTQAGTGIAGTVTLQGQWSSTSTSGAAGADGNFVTHMTVPTSEGQYVIVGNYGGDATHASSSTSITIVVSNQANNGNGSGNGNATCGLGSYDNPLVGKGHLVELPNWFCGTSYGFSNWILFVFAVIVILGIVWWLSRKG